jgi:hypothetical protein
MAVVSTNPGKYCIRCEYALEGVSGGVCPECGRGFDPDDPLTFVARPRWRRRMRVLRRVGIAAGVVVVALVFMPRGYTSATVKFTCLCGRTMTCSRMQLIPPSWLKMSYPHWTEIPAVKPVAEGHSHLWTWNLVATRRNLTWRGTMVAGGGLTAMGQTQAAWVGTVNDLPVTPEDVGAVLADVAGTMARTRGYGVRVKLIPGTTQVAPESAQPSGR